MLDFTDTGEIGLLIDEGSVALREATIGEGGILPGKELAFTFGTLRANDLIWRYVVDSYLKGATPDAFDLLYWDSDSVSLPGPMYCWYTRNTYLENNIKEPARPRSAACRWICQQYVRISYVLLEQAARELSAREQRRLRRRRRGGREALLRRAARADRPRARRGLHAQVVRAHARDPLRGGGPGRRPARDAGPRDRAPRGPQDAARRHAAADGRQREEVRSRVRDNPRRVRGAAALHRGARAGAGPGARQPHPGRFVDTALAASYFADEAAVEARREELRATLPIGRVVGPADVAALAVHLMTNTAVTGATYDIDGGQRLIE